MKKTLLFALFCTLLYSENIENNFLVSEENASQAELIKEDKLTVLPENLESNTSQSENAHLQLNDAKNNVRVVVSEENSNFKDNNQQNLQTTNINSQEPTAVVFPKDKQENYPIIEDKQQNINQAQNQQNYQNIENSAPNQQNAYPQNYNQGNVNQSNSQNYNPQNSQNYQQNQASYNQGNAYQNNANPSQVNNYNQQNQQYQQQVNPNYNQANSQAYNQVSNSQNYQNTQNNQNYQNPQNFNQAQQNYNQGNPQYQQQGNQQNYNQGAYNQQNQAYQQNYNQPNNQQNYQNAQNNPQYQNTYPQNYNPNQGNAYQNNANQAQQQYYNQQNQGNQQQYYPNQQELTQAQNYNQPNQAYQQNYNQANNQQNYQNPQIYNQGNQAQAVNVPEKAKSSFKITDIDLIAIAKFIVGAFLLGIIFIVFKHGKRILTALIWPFKKIWKATKIVSEFSSFVAKKLIIEYPTRAFNAVIIEPAKAIGDFSVKAFNATKDGLSNLGSGFVNLFKGEGKARTNFQMDIVSMKSLGELNAYQIKNKMSVDHEAEAFQDFSALSKIFSNKKMVIDFDFDLHFIYDLNDPNFKMEQVKANEFNIKMPTCKYRYSVKNINIHSEESSKLKILPNLKFGLISKGFSHEEKNALVKEAMNKNEMDLIRKEIEATKVNIQESAMKSITNLAKSFGNKDIKLNFEFNDTELLNADALEMEMIEDKKQSDKMSNVIEVEQLTKKED